MPYGTPNEMESAKQERKNNSRELYKTQQTLTLTFNI